MEEAATTSVTPSCRILLVEDDRDLAESLQAGLENEHLKMTLAGNGSAALESLRSHAFDLILLDLGLPGMSGQDILQHLKAQPEWQHIPVILLTAKDSIEDKVRGFDQGATDYITKPFDLVELRARVKSTLRMRHLQRELLQANHNLRAARRAAEETAAAKAEFLANMSHEIRTPMNGVIAMTSLLMQTELATDQRDLVETIRTSGESLLTIINDILNFSKLESGKMELERQPLNLRACVEEALDLLASKAGEKQLDLAYHIDPQVPQQIVGDVTRLRQILVNLLGNAIKFTPAGEIFVRVDKDSSGANLHFSVRDTGIGIPSDRLSRLFQSFSQVDSSIARQYGGTGLGLAISKGLVGLMGGSMWVESSEGEGSTFHFNLPLVAVPDSSPRLQAHPEWQGLRVLLIEDSATARFAIAQHLQDWGMVSIEAQSWQHALDLLRRGQAVDLAIIDLQLPGAASASLVEELRKLPSLDSLPIVILTSVYQSKAQTSSESFLTALVNKPVKTAQLESALFQLRSGTSAPAKKVQSKSKLDSSMGARIPLRILLTDDNAINQKVALRLLQQLGYKADTANNGLEAIQALERKAYDIILMDVQMPELDGLAATHRIRERQKEPKPHEHFRNSIIIIAMTANAMQGDREKCLAAGMNDYLPKPVRPEDLQAMLERHGTGVASQSSMKTPGAPVASTPDAEVPTLTVLPPVDNRQPVISQPPVDLERLNDFAGGNANNFNELVTLYLKQTTEQLQQIRDAIAQNDAERCSRVAHSCAGASATCGMIAIVPLLRQVESLSQENKLPAATALLTPIDIEFERLKHYLETHKPIALAG